MNIKRMNIAFRITALILAIVFILPVGVTAAETRSSLYLNAYTAYIYPAGWGKIQVWFSVDGTGDMDDVDVL